MSTPSHTEIFKHRLAFTSLWTVTTNVTLGRLQTVESAVHSVWDTLRTTSLSDTANSASVWASNCEPQRQQQYEHFHNRIITLFNLYAIDIDQI